MAANMWKNSLKNVESYNNKILYKLLLDFFSQRTILTFWISTVYKQKVTFSILLLFQFLQATFHFSLILSECFGYEISVTVILWWGKFSKKHNYKYMAKWWCLLAMEELLHVSAYSGHLQVLTTFLLKEFYIICVNRVVMLRSHHHFTCFCYAKLVGCQWICR